jgi:periplasmic protein TonB
MVTATELARPEIALHWHEAVAVVAETAAMLLARGITSVPDPASIVLTPDGTLHLLDDGPPGPAPAQRLAGMLDALLSSSPCPPELRRLADESLADPPAFATIEEFADALAFFERPGRNELLAAVAARASEAALDARAHTELERLEARTRSQPRKTEARPEETPSHSNRRRIVVLFAGSLLVSVVAGGILGFRAIDSEARANGTPATITERVRERVDRIARKGLEAVGLRTPAPPSPTSPEVTAPPRVAPRPSRRASRELPVTISVKELAGGHVSLPPSTVTPESPEPIVRDEAVYTAAAEDVEPAVLARPHLPSRPPTDATSEEIGVLEIVVSATGAVEQVRLVSTSNRYQDRMIVAAAKAWQFEPATKNGQPVRYRTRIRITL